MKKFIKVLIIIFLILGTSIGILFLVFKDLKYGLDLKGGFEVLYQVKPLEGKELDDDALTATYKTIQSRINVLGVTEPEIFIEGSDRIRVRLAGVKNEDEARKILTVAANITFRDTNDNLLMDSDVISKAKVGTDDNGNPAVALQVKDKEKFYEVTSNISKSDNPYIVIWLDYEEGDSYATDNANCGKTDISNCLSAATVSQGFASDVVISGSFTNDEVKTLVELINSGTINTKLEEISSKTVNASLGENTLHDTLFAGIIALGLIVVFMTIIYHFSGFIAGLSLIIYTAIIFGLFWLIGGVLTLPGVAAIVLGVGMAIDANILLFERLKEELLTGKSLSSAFKLASSRSFAAIFDANITTLIVAIILFCFGASSVKGFATMLIITLIATIIVMIWINKYFFRKIINTGMFDYQEIKFIKFKKKNINKTEKFIPFKKINFMKHRKLTFIIPIILLIIGIVSIITNGFNLSIDFAGGSSITASGNEKLTVNVLKEEINSLGYNVVDAESIDENDNYVKIEQILTKEEINKVNETLLEKYDAVTEISVVSSLVSKELIKSAGISLLIAFIAIIIYISIRFEWKFAISSIIALINDVVITIIMFSIFKFKISNIFVAAILTIIGYSINNTIVVFDRIRENINQSNNKKTLSELISILNNSLRETLLRNIYTTLTTLIPIISLIILGSYEIIYFNIALAIGLLAGLYSSLLLSTGCWLIFNKNGLSKELKKQKKNEEIIIQGVND